MEFIREEFFSAGVYQEEFLGARDQLWWLTPRHLKIRKSVSKQTENIFIYKGKNNKSQSYCLTDGMPDDADQL